MYLDSVKPEHWYFFAVTGLNITQKLLAEFTDNHRFDKVILENLDLLIKTSEAKRVAEKPQEKPAELTAARQTREESEDSEETKLEKRREAKKVNLQLQMLQERTFSRSMVVDLFTHLYFEVFKMFNDKWAKDKPGIMAFTQFLDKVYYKKFLPRSRKIVRDYFKKLKKEG